MDGVNSFSLQGPTWAAQFTKPERLPTALDGTWVGLSYGVLETTILNRGLYRSFRIGDQTGTQNEATFGSFDIIDSSHLSIFYGISPQLNGTTLIFNYTYSTGGPAGPCPTLTITGTVGNGTFTVLLYQVQGPAVQRSNSLCQSLVRDIAYWDHSKRCDFVTSMDNHRRDASPHGRRN